MVLFHDHLYFTPFMLTKACGGRLTIQCLKEESAANTDSMRVNAQDPRSYADGQAGPGRYAV